MNNRIHDADIVATSSIVSLKCPISASRIVTPCRSTACTHNQCFDAQSYLQMQEQAPTWSCPICNKAAPFEILTIDQYVEEILKSTPCNIEQVTIEPDGQWHTNSSEERARQTNPTPNSDDDDDDVVELREDRLGSIKKPISYTNHYLDAVRTPPVSSSSREQSIASSAPRSSKASSQRSYRSDSE